MEMQGTFGEILMNIESYEGYPKDGDYAVFVPMEAVKVVDGKDSLNADPPVVSGFIQTNRWTCIWTRIYVILKLKSTIM